MQSRSLLPLTLAFALLAACTPAPVAGPLTPTPPVPEAAATPPPVDVAMTPAPIAPRQAAFVGTVLAPPHLHPIAETFMSNNGGTFISHHGGTFMSNNGGTFMSNNGGTYRTLDVTQRLVADVEVALATPDGELLKTLDGQPSVRTDANGRFAFPQIPTDKSFVVVALLRGPNGQTGLLQSLGRASGKPVHVSAAATLVTSAILKRNRTALDTLDLARFAKAVQETAARLDDTQLPDFSDGDKVAAAMEALTQRDVTLRNSVTMAATPTTSPSPSPSIRPAGGAGDVVGAPQDLESHNVGTTTARLSWAPLSGAAHYAIYRDDEVAPFVTNLQSPGYQLTGLTPGQAYTYRVTGTGGNGESPKSDALMLSAARAGTLRFSVAPTSPVERLNIGSVVLADNGRLYVGGSGGHLRAYTSEGLPLWTVQLSGALRTPVVDPASGDIYLAASDKLFKVTAEGASVAGFPVVASSLMSGPPAIAEDGGVYYATTDGHVSALTSDGTRSWTYPAGAGVGSFTTSPVIGRDGVVYVGNSNGHVYAIESNGTGKWTYPTGAGVGTFSSPLALGDDGTLYAGNTQNSQLHAIAPNGLSATVAALDGIVEGGPAIGVNGEVYVGTSFGSLYAFGEGLNGEIWPKVSVSGGVPLVPTLGIDNTLYAVDDSGVLHAFSTEDGTPAWAPLTLTGPIGGLGLALSDDGTLYVAGQTLQAVNTLSLGLMPSTWPKHQRDNASTGRQPAGN